MYSSSVGRFLERDPIGYSEDGLNLYQAYRSNPIAFVDPSGLLGECDCKQFASEVKDAMFADPARISFSGLFSDWMPPSSYSGSTVRMLNRLGLKDDDDQLGEKFNKAWTRELGGGTHGFASILAPNGAQNFGHVAGILYASRTQPGYKAILAQVDEDLRQYKAAPNATVQAVKCAEMMVDIIALKLAQQILKAEASMTKSIAVDPDPFRDALTKAWDGFNLEEKLCGNGLGLTCAEAYTELRRLRDAMREDGPRGLIDAS